jgi:hypothetical protein
VFGQQFFFSRPGVQVNHSPQATRDSERERERERGGEEGEKKEGGGRERDGDLVDWWLEFGSLVARFASLLYMLYMLYIPYDRAYSTCSTFHMIDLLPLVRLTTNCLSNKGVLCTGTAPLLDMTAPCR